MSTRQKPINISTNTLPTIVTDVYIYILLLWKNLTARWKEHPTSSSSRNVFLINFHLNRRFFKINSWLGTYKEHLIIIIELLSIKSEILLYLCETLCLYKNQIMRFPHFFPQVSECNMQIWLLEKVFLFFSNLAKGWEQQNTFFKKWICQNFHLLEIYTR